MTIYHRAIEKYGHDNQWRQLVEEATELALEITRLWRSRVNGVSK